MGRAASRGKDVEGRQAGGSGSCSRAVVLPPLRLKREPQARRTLMGMVTGCRKEQRSSSSVEGDEEEREQTNGAKLAQDIVERAGELWWRVERQQAGEARENKASHQLAWLQHPQAGKGT